MNKKELIKYEIDEDGCISKLKISEYAINIIYKTKEDRFDLFRDCVLVHNLNLEQALKVVYLFENKLYEVI